MQRAFASEGIWIPRDAYQQERFCQKVAISADQQQLLPADLVFFGRPQRCTHVGLYLEVAATYTAPAKCMAITASPSTRCTAGTTAQWPPTTAWNCGVLAECSAATMAATFPESRRP